MSQLIKTKYSSFVIITGRRGRGTKKIKRKMGIIKVTMGAVIGLLSRHAARAPRGRGLRTCPWARLVIRVSGVRLHSPVGGARGDQQEAGTGAQRHGRG